MSQKRKLIKHSIYKSIIVTLLFIFVYQLYNIEIVRNKFEDAGFDITAKMFFSTKAEKVPNAPKVVVFGFDDLYMQKNHLFDEDNATNYGYLFPRLHIANFIKELDTITATQKRLNKKMPKALFIDMDVSFGSLVDGNLSKEDEALLDVLEEVNRSYPIIFPKTQTANFIEFSNRAKIQEMIKSKQIIFASVGLRNSLDNATRRYVTYKKIHNRYDANTTTYMNAQIILWNRLKAKDGNITLVQKSFEEHDIIANRILFKQYQKAKYLNPLTKMSYWENYRYYSAEYHFHGSDEDVYSDAVVMLGTTYHNNNDTFEVLSTSNAINMAGVEVQANVLLTLFYLNGQLKPFPLWATILVVFVLVFLIDYGVAYLLYRLNKKENKWTTVGVLVLALGLMLLASLILLHYGYWFNWFIPMILYDLIDVILG